MGTARVIFRNKGAAPVAVPVRPVLFVTPAPPLLPDSSREHDFDKPMTGEQFDLIAKALHDGAISAEDAARARDAWVCFKPLPADLIDAVIELSS
ncbi:hypothetical protein [Paraburkholderia sacchari]|uniref:hypothetical protein n=1 Tax=Paraburkholderia sacchari TaxID=159450 RepID=UPI003D982AC1